MLILLIISLPSLVEIQWSSQEVVCQAGVVVPQSRASGSMVVSGNKYETGSMYVKWVIVLTTQNKPASNSPLSSAQNNSASNSHPGRRGGEEESKRRRMGKSIYVPSLCETKCNGHQVSSH